MTFFVLYVIRSSEMKYKRAIFFVYAFSRFARLAMASISAFGGAGGF